MLGNRYIQIGAEGCDWDSASGIVVAFCLRLTAVVQVGSGSGSRFGHSIGQKMVCWKR